MRFFACVSSVFAVLLIPAVVPGAEPAAPMEAGLAVVEVTPPLAYRMSGYFHERLSTGTHDPLKAKAIVFGQGGNWAGMVFCDLIGVPAELSRRVRRLAEQKTGIPAANILIAATHTHTGPLYFGALRQHFHDAALVREGRDPHEKEDYAATLVERLAGAIADARAAVEPVRLHAGIGRQEGLSFNRRFHMKDGPVRFNPGALNPNIVRAAGPIDPDVGIVLIRRGADDRPLASLTVFALHLDTVGGTNYSADYPFYLEQSLRQELGEEFVSLFGNGTCGDINHIDVTRRDRLKTDVIGTTLAGTVKQELPRLKPIQRPSLAARNEIIRVPLQRFSEEEVAWAKRAIQKVGSGELQFLERVKAYKIMACKRRGTETLPIEVQVFRLGGELAIVALPGEVFVDLGLAIKKASPFATTLVIELAHDAPGYLPTRKAFAEGSYETVNSRIQPGGGEMMVETAVKLLGQLKQDAR